MTKMEDLTTVLVDNSTAELLLLQGWGKPQGNGLGPRTRVPQRLNFDPEKIPSKTQQSFCDECNINRIMAKHRKTGELTHLNKREPTYGDFSSGLDYQAAQNAVLAAQADFDSLSAEIRARMGNNPAKLLAFVNDPENFDEAVELGLIPKPENTPTADPSTSAEPPVDESPPSPAGAE